MKASRLILSVRIVFQCNNDGYISQNVKTFDAASFSGFLAMATYMCNHYPDLYPPGCEHLTQNWIDTEIFPPYLTFNKYFEPWCDYFNELLDQKHINGLITQKDHTMYLICNVKQVYFKHLKQRLNFEKFEPFYAQTIQNLLDQTKFAKSKQERLKVGIINFASSQLKHEPFAPKVNLLSLFTGIWFQHEDSWRKYDVLKEDYPSQEEILSKDIFILSGSSYSVNDNLPQVDKIMKLLKQGLKKNKNLKLLGLCFGHQAIAHHFGGKVIRRQRYAGLEIVKFHKEKLQKFPHFQLLTENQKQGYVVSQFHSDYVSEVPKGFVNIGYSSSCQNESLMSEDGRIITFQFHCEYTKGYAYGYQLRLNKYFDKDYDVLKAKPKNQPDKYNIQRHHESSKIIRDVVRKFIEWRIK